MSQEFNRLVKERDEVVWQAAQVAKVVNELIAILLEFHRQVGRFLEAVKEARNEQGTEKGS